MNRLRLRLHLFIRLKRRALSGSRGIGSVSGGELRRLVWRAAHVAHHRREASMTSIDSGLTEGALRGGPHALEMMQLSANRSAEVAVLSPLGGGPVGTMRLADAYCQRFAAGLDGSTGSSA